MVLLSKENMHRAYRLADELMKDRLREKAPEILEEMEGLADAEIIVTRGQYDHIEQVLQAAGMKFRLVSPAQIDRAELLPEQIVFVNCPGTMSEIALKKLRAFVEAGGFLFTTDWAIREVLEPAFPGFVRFNGRKTADEVVRVEMLDLEDPFLGVLFGSKDDPQWWLEGSSYPITVLKPECVKVIIGSKELAERYGEGAVFVTFPVGEGRVYHMISHFYLQRSETRTQRHTLKAMDYVNEKGIKPEMYSKFLSLGAEDVDLASVESAYSSRGMVERVLLEKRRQARRARGE